MSRITSLMIAILVMAPVAVLNGCLAEPRYGTTLPNSDTSHSSDPTTATDTSVHEDSGIDTFTDPDSSLTSDTRVTNPPISQFRPCTSDQQCINSEPAGTYYCSDGGLCVSYPMPCTKDADCHDSNVCNGVETCWYGSCYLAPLLSCDDQNPLTRDDCNPSTGCIHWDINECTKDEQCRPGFTCDFDSYRCVPAKSCTTDVDCDDVNACTADRCLDQRCANDRIICFDFDPATLNNVCDPEVGCIFPKGCSSNRDCVDWDIGTRDECISGTCVFTLEYIHVSTFSRLPTQQGDRVDYIMTDTDGQNIVHSDALPSLLYLPFQPICANGLYVDIYDPDDECDQYYPLTDIDVWREIELLPHILVFDECGERIFVSPENFGCNTIFFSP